MNDEGIKTVVKLLDHYFDQRNPDRLLALAADDVQWEGAGFLDHACGKDDLRKLIEVTYHKTDFPSDYKIIDQMEFPGIDDTIQVSLQLRLKDPKTNTPVDFNLLVKLRKDNDTYYFYYVKAEQASSSDYTFKHLVDKNKEGMLVIDRKKYQILYINDEARRIFGYADRDIRFSDNCFKILYGSDKLCDKCPINSCSFNEKDEWQMDLADGARHVKISSDSISWFGVPALVHYLHDDTENVNVINNISSMVDRIPSGIGIYQFNEDHMIKRDYLNKGFYQMLGNKIEDDTKYGNPMERVYADDRQKVLDAIEIAFDKDHYMDLEIRIFDGNNKLVWMKLDGYVTIGYDGSAIGYVSFTNIDKIKKLQNELSVNEQIKDVAINTTKISLWTYDIKNHSLFINAQDYRTMKLQKVVKNVPESLIELGFCETESIADFKELYQKADSTDHDIVSAKIKVKKKDGSGYKWEKISYTPVIDNDGIHRISIGTSVDISEQVQAELEYTKELKVLESIINSSNGYMKYNITKNEINEISKDYKTFVDQHNIKTVDEFYDNVAAVSKLNDFKNEQEFVDLFNRESLLKHFRAGERVIRFEHYINDINNSPKWYQTYVKMAENPETKDVEAITYSVDISDQVMLKQINQFVVKRNFIFVCIIDAKTGNILFINTVNQKGIVLKQSFEKSMNERYAGTEPDRFRVENKLDIIEDNIEKKGSYTVFFEAKVNGELKHYKLIYAKIEDHDREIACICQDITDVINEEQKHSNQLQQALEKAQHASVAKSDFLSMMSHDIRTPMNAIIGMTDLALDESNDEIALDYLRKIKSSSKYLLGLINEILDMSKIESNKLTLRPEPYLIIDFIANMEVALSTQCVKKNQSFVIKLQDKNGNTLKREGSIIVDKLHFKQIFLNLLSNASKYTPEGGKIEFTIIEMEKHDEEIKFRFIVKDNGIGISDEFKPHIYESFAQEDRAETMNQGTGLGLAIVKQMVRLMHGKISFTSEKDKGTQFVIDMKIKVVSESNSNLAKPKIINDFSLLKGKHILLVEDQPLNTEIAKRILEKQGMVVDTADNGKKGFDQFIKSKPGYYDLILMDVKMPVMDGLTTTRTIRRSSHPDAKNIPIIAMTANAFNEDIKKSLEAGMNDHLTKPIDVGDLYKTLLHFIKS